MSDRVLVIEDSLPMQQLIHSHLSDQSIECISAYDGERGVAIAESHHPSVILLDIDLPNADGFEICARLRANTRTANIPIIFLTADYNTNDKIRGLEMGAVDYITKPCNYAELAVRLRAAIRLRKLADQHAMRDTLTGLFSKAYLDNDLATRIPVARRTGQPLSCIVADIDDLKRINQLRGRGVGDDLICKVGNAVANKCTRSEIPCALGGGMFAILGLASDRHAAARLAMRQSIHIGREFGSSESDFLDISCSFGVADIEIAESYTLLDRARAAMRRAKSNGPNSISVARPARQRARVAA